MTQMLTPVHAPHASRARGAARGLLFVCGWLALLLGAIGVVLPLLPTAPFLLLAVACFSRSSPAMVRRIHRLPMVGAYLRDWHENGISPRMKWGALAALWITAAATLVTVKTLLLRSAVLAVAVLSSLHFLFMPTRRRPSDPPR